MGFQDEAFLPSRASSTPYFSNIVVDDKALGPPHLLELCLSISKGMLPVKYVCTNKSSLCE